MGHETPLVADRIGQDVALVGGKPVVKGTQIPVESVLGHLADNLDLDDLFAAYPELTVEDVQAALAYAAPEQTETAGQALLRLAGIAGTGPADLSARIDDYLYGQDS